MPLLADLMMLRPKRAWCSIGSMVGKPVFRVVISPPILALCDQGMLSLTNFGTGLLVARACGRTEFGVYALALTLVVFATDLSAALITTPYTVFSPQMSLAARKQYLTNQLVCQAILSTLFALVVAVGGAVGSRLGLIPDYASHIVTVTAGVTIFVTLREFVRRASFAEMNVGKAFSVDLCGCLIQAGGVFLLLRFDELTVSRACMLLGLAAGVSASCWLATRRINLRLTFRGLRQDLKRDWRFAKWVLGSGMLWAFAMYIYPWILAAFHGTSATGIWAACSGVVALGNPVLQGLGNYIGPRISTVWAASGPPAMARCVYRSALLLAALLLPLVLVLCGFGERVVVAMYGRPYAGNALIVSLLGLNLLISAVAYSFSRGLFTLDRSKSDMFVNIIALVLLLTVGVGATKAYGVLGAAAALLASNGITLLVRAVAFAWEVRIRSQQWQPDAGQRPHFEPTPAEFVP